MQGEEWARERRRHFESALGVALDLPLASLGSRGIAVLVDTVITFALFAAMMLLATLLSGFLPAIAGPYVLAAFVVGLFVINWLYFALCERFMRGATPGKKLMRLRVVDRHGGPPELVESLIRNLLRNVDLLPSGYGVGVVAMLATRSSQRLGDLAAGTFVVSEEKAPQSGTSTTRRWPARFAPVDVALVEAYFERIADLPPAARTAVSSKMLAWLERVDPNRLESVGDATDAVEKIEFFFASGAD